MIAQQRRKPNIYADKSEVLTQQNTAIKYVKLNRMSALTKIKIHILTPREM